METIYDALVEELGDPFTCAKGDPLPSKRDKHRAGQLTGKVWAVINGRNDKPAVIDGIEVHPAVPVS